MSRIKMLHSYDAPEIIPVGNGFFLLFLPQSKYGFYWEEESLLDNCC